jgi:hypothetical protein
MVKIEKRLHCLVNKKMCEFIPPGLKYKKFEEVAVQDLVVGVKYVLKNYPSSRCYFTGIFKEHHEYYQVFESVMYHTCSISCSSITCRFNQKRYYQNVSQKEQIQQAMEKRALDKILKQLINDDFTW